jgi:meiotically up-regulated gene 157 (Mug157) protein
LVEKTIERIKAKCADKEIAWLFENCFPNTLDTTVSHSLKEDVLDTFVITGDIHAMWLRDSTAQVWPYLEISKDSKPLQDLILGVINRQAACIIIDPYANAFNEKPEKSEWYSDHTAMKPELHERKWEIDSLCYHIRLSYHFWKKIGRKEQFTSDWLKSAKLIVDTFIEQQRLTSKGPYRFGRTTSWSTDTVPGNGYGNNTKPNGMIHSIFRPSDDATQYPFLIPSNLFAVKSLEQIAEISQVIYQDNAFAQKCNNLAKQVQKAIQQFGIVKHPDFGSIYAMEVDGFGNALFQDDANVPNLLSLPYLGLLKTTDPIYINTRRFVLSSKNPYYFKGKAAEGIGSPHTLVNQIWPMSLIMRAMTSQSDSEILQQLKFLKNTHANTGFMHESFDKDDSAKFTRKWFAWANTLFGELILKVEKERPHLLKQVL